MKNQIFFEKFFAKRQKNRYNNKNNFKNMDFLVGIILVLAGISMIRYRFQVYNFVGEWDWAIKYVGGTVNAISIAGALLIFVGVAFPLGAFNNTKTLPNAISGNQTQQTATGVNFGGK